MALPFKGRSTPFPPSRRLRTFAFDPSLSRSIDTHEINEVTIKLPWEEDLRVGPVDEYFEVVDVDPASQAFYPPVDLNDINILAQDGLPPSEGNPQFHQQMVYAVARTTIRHFEWALGRRALWSPRWAVKDREEAFEFVEKLRIYPHALREANAYYSPSKKALLFGYFPASTIDPGMNLPGEIVFTCLSHDIIAHETTHALLDGLHRRFIEPTNVDVWALHEAFADIVALFQHFTYPEVLRHQIARTRGQLENQNLLAQLAQQFGQAIGHYGALRDSLGQTDKKTGEWKPKEIDPQEIHRTTEPHARGAILVAAVFDAFLTIYKRRIADLLRIATGGTGELPPGELHPDLVDRLAREASKTAGHILNMCIRALDYCPPVDVDFGDYLRALITADFDLVPDDRYNYRLAFIEAFRERGIYPHDVRHLSVESLIWDKPDKRDELAFKRVFRNPKKTGESQKDYDETKRMRTLVPDWGLKTKRAKIYKQARRSQAILHQWLTRKRDQAIASAAHFVMKKREVDDSYYRDDDCYPTLEIHSVRPTRRVGPGGQAITELVVEMTQRRRGYFNSDAQADVDSGRKAPSDPDFIFRGGCTLLVDPDTAKVRYCIYKNIDDEDRLERTRTFLTGEENPSLRETYFGDPRRMYFQRFTEGRDEKGMEPFAMLHRSFEGEEVL